MSPLHPFLSFRSTNNHSWQRIAIATAVIVFACTLWIISLVLAYLIALLPFPL